MQGKKAIFLFLALLLPVFVFLFLKFFGKNEFAVVPLYQEEMPVNHANCSAQILLPYRIADSVMSQLDFGNDSLLLIWFGTLKPEGKIQAQRISEIYTPAELHQSYLPIENQKTLAWKQCVFFLKKQYDVVLLDWKGLIRGEYTSYDREEIDRLMTELDIILKKY